MIPCTCTVNVVYFLGKTADKLLSTVLNVKVKTMTTMTSEIFEDFVGNDDDDDDDDSYRR